MEAYSLDLRERIVAACDEGSMTNGEVAEAFGVGRWFVQKLLRQRRKTGSLVPLPRGRGPDPLLGRTELKAVGKLCKQRQDATLDELCDALKKDGGPEVGRTTMFQALRRLGLPLKKRPCGPASRRRLGSNACGTGGANGPRRCLRRTWFLWTRAGRTPR